MADRKADRHKNRAIPFRPQERDGARLRAYAEYYGYPVNDILRDALTAWLDEQDRSDRREISR